MYRCVFAFYQDPTDGMREYASYLVLDPGETGLGLNSNVSGEQLLEAGKGIPFTPTYRTWLNKGRPVYRG